jgi:site-specific recombinase XerC
MKATTASTYARYVRQDIAPSNLGGMKLTDIRRTHVNAWVADLTKAGRGAVTVRRALPTLRMIFTQAVRDEIIPANPAIMVDKPTVADHGERHWDPNTLRCFWSGAHITGWGRCSSSLYLPVYGGVRSPACTGRMLTWTAPKSL